jgi:hypothetical protein
VRLGIYLFGTSDGRKAEEHVERIRKVSRVMCGIPTTIPRLRFRFPPRHDGQKQPEPKSMRARP